MPKVSRTLSKQEYSKKYYEMYKDRMREKSLNCYYERKKEKPDKMESYKNIINLFQLL